MGGFPYSAGVWFRECRRIAHRPDRRGSSVTRASWCGHGTLLGKQVGVFGLSLLAVGLGLAKKPENSSWLQIYGVSVLCGIGFTMSLFIGNLAFAESQLLIDEVKVGVLVGSVLSALTGALIMLLPRQR